MSHDADFSGQVTLYSSHSGFPGPKEQPGVTFRAEFDGSSVRITQFAPVVVEDIGTDIGPLDLTVTMSGEGSGSFDAATGALSVNVRFRFKLSSPLAPPSRLVLTVHDGPVQMPDGTTRQGSPVEVGSGKLLLVAAGVFEHGALDGVHCGVILDGALQPPPL
jgi:hypothetical protein